MKIEYMLVTWKCQRCPSQITDFLDVEGDDKGKLTIRKPPECYAEQEGCGRKLGQTDFDLIKIEDLRDKPPSQNRQECQP